MVYCPKRPDTAFDLVFIDPPYGRDLLVPALEKALENGWIAPGGLILAEVRDRDHGPGCRTHCRNGIVN